MHSFGVFTSKTNQYPPLPVVHRAVQIRFNSYLFPYPPYTYKCSSSFTFVLSASLDIICILPFTSALYPPNFSMDSISSRLPPICLHTLSTTLFHRIPARPFVTFSQTYQLWLATSFLECSSLYIAISTFLRVDLFLSGHIPSSALNTLLLVVLEHPGAFLAAITCIVSSCFTNIAFPSHTSAYYNFGTITFTRIHILNPVSRCLRVPYPFLVRLRRGHPKSSTLRSLRQGTIFVT